MAHAGKINRAEIINEYRGLFQKRPGNFLDILKSYLETDPQDKTAEIYFRLTDISAS